MTCTVFLRLVPSLFLSYIHAENYAENYAESCEHYADKIYKAVALTVYTRYKITA